MLFKQLDKTHQLSNKEYSEHSQLFSWHCLVLAALNVLKIISSFKTRQFISDLKIHCTTFIDTSLGHADPCIGSWHLFHKTVVQQRKINTVDWKWGKWGKMRENTTD